MPEEDMEARGGGAAYDDRRVQREHDVRQRSGCGPWVGWLCAALQASCCERGSACGRACVEEQSEDGSGPSFVSPVDGSD